jgi:hypothetical protein
MAGYSGTPLQRKLGIKSGFRMTVVDPPQKYFDWISPLPEDVRVATRLAGEMDFIHVFVMSRSAFQKKFNRSKLYLAKTGTLWVSWPKKASGVITDLDENFIREFGLKSGLVDVKVCAVDEVWSGLKFVYRLKDRLT